MSIKNICLSLICIAVVAWILMKRKTSEAYNRKVVSLILITSVIVFLVGIAGLISMYFVPFNSLETAYKLGYGGDISVVVEGTKSDYVIGNRESHYLNKSEKGWRIPIISIAVTKGLKKIDATTIYVSQYNFSEDYYIKVLNTEYNSLDISDSSNSKFYKINDEEDDKQAKGCIYHAHVYKIDNEYSITINGINVKLMQ
jgi:hypothetical protein